MRGALCAFSLVAAITTAIGCAQDKYNMKPVQKEEPILPPDEKRYNEPDTAGYRKPPPPKDEKALIGRQGGSMPGLGGGGFGP